MSKIDELIAELCPNGVEYKCLSDISKINRGIRVVKKQLSETGEYPVYQNSLTPLGYYGDKNRNAGTSFVISAGAAGDMFCCVMVMMMVWTGDLAGRLPFFARPIRTGCSQKKNWWHMPPYIR